MLGAAYLSFRLLRRLGEVAFVHLLQALLGPVEQPCGWSGRPHSIACTTQPKTRPWREK